MKQHLLVVALAATTLSAAATVFAADGQINFTGEIIDQSCKVMPDANKSLQVDLHKVARAAFTGKGSTAAATKFTLQLTDCPESVKTASVKFDGTSVQGDNKVLALTQEEGVASGVGIQLYDDASKVIPLYTSSKAYSLKSGKELNNLDFIARYIATANEVKPGVANSTASFTINYN
ncbi:fimbrial protein [Salmonella enterica]|nr:type 1 fimbrial protein [Salmonella enterica subsp. enterica serovar Sandiego]EEK2576830.1 fimbrial protein [Salmonella enterica subsp. enterica serovar Montevideo]